MGYTHYWTKTREFTDAEWLDIMTAAASILSTAINSYMITLVYESDQLDKKPLVSDPVIRFNGADDDGHETFYFDRCANDFEFCKTARKDYDAPVVAILIAARNIAPDAISWRSDGWLSEHADAVQLYNEACDADLEWSNVDPSDNDPDIDKVTNVRSLDHARDLKDAS